ncbi:MAG: methyl-accepting chemotaxis protein [Roseateles depolymerans]|uniref:Methyl-accepting chemotaxis protein n=1 Tax=Roseateles depolymerans TaxID=76731 RepID=A0A2W5DSZ9_9BURK|nr:MAG: methyl-accepting chemotaxis protein [Roseateles depolymerans]
MKLSSLTVRARLTAAFSLMSALLAVIVALAWMALEHESDAFEHYVRGIGARAAIAAKVRHAVDARAIAARNLVLVSAPADIEAERQAVTAAHKAATDELATLERMAQAPEVSAKARELIAEIARVEAAYAPVALGIVDAALNGRRDEAIKRMNEECRPLLARLVKASDDYTTYTEHRAEQMIEESDQKVAWEQARFLAVSALSLLTALVAGFLITRSLSRALGAEPDALSAAAERVASGDLSATLGNGRVPAGSVMASLERMQGSLVSIVQQVRDASECISTGTTQIATGNADLSQRTEEQASALQQTAATMDELGTTVRHNADNAAQANELASTAQETAVRGGQVVGDMIATMREIDASSKRIGDIIGTIDGIAFQTNILALNAAVEAARAGEQGRGFAVVASEVRTLAKRSADAAKEIKGLISASVAQVENGSRLVDHAGTTMQEVVAAVQRVSGIVAEISVASREQSTGVGQVGQAVAQIDNVTQQNAALVEESAAAAESLRRQASDLVAAVAVFSLR